MRLTWGKLLKVRVELEECIRLFPWNCFTIVSGTLQSLRTPFTLIKQTVQGNKHRLESTRKLMDVRVIKVDYDHGIVVPIDKSVQVFPDILPRIYAPQKTLVDRPEMHDSGLTYHSNFDLT